MPIFDVFYPEEICPEMTEATSDMFQQQTALFLELAEDNFYRAIKDVENLSQKEGVLS